MLSNNGPITAVILLPLNRYPDIASAIKEWYLSGQAAAPAVPALRLRHTRAPFLKFGLYARAVPPRTRPFAAPTALANWWDLSGWEAAAWMSRVAGIPPRGRQGEWASR